MFNFGCIRVIYLVFVSENKFNSILFRDSFRHRARSFHAVCEISFA